MDNLVGEFASNAVAQRIGWALLHFVWQGAALGLLAAAGLQLLRKRSPQARWAVASAALALMAIASVATACLIAPLRPAAPLNPPSEGPFRSAGEHPASSPDNQLNIAGSASSNSPSVEQFADENVSGGEHRLIAGRQVQAPSEAPTFDRAAKQGPIAGRGDAKRQSGWGGGDQDGCLLTRVMDRCMARPIGR